MTDLKNLLSNIVHQFGNEVLSQDRCVAIMKDLMPSIQSAQLNTIRYFISQGINAKIYDTYKSSKPEMLTFALSNLKQSILENNFFTPEHITILDYIFELTNNLNQTGNNVSIEWWQELSSDWKGIFFSNIKSTRDNSDEIIVDEIRGLKEFEIRSENITNLTPLVVIKELTNLVIAYCWSLTDLSSIAELKKLTNLGIYGSSLTNLSTLSKLQNLSCLEIYHFNSLTDLAPLSKLQSLYSLEIHECNSLIDFSPLSELKNLNQLSLDVPYMIDLTPIYKLQSLSQLLLCRWEGEGSDLNQIGGMTQLIHLQLFVLEYVEDLEFIVELKNLNKLEISYCYNLKDFNSLATLKRLSHLEIEGCENLKDISPLAELKMLNHLEIVGCYNLKDISPLSELRKLDHIKIYDCKNLPRIDNKSELIAYLNGNKQRDFFVDECEFPF